MWRAEDVGADCTRLRRERHDRSRREVADIGRERAQVLARVAHFLALQPEYEAEQSIDPLCAFGHPRIVVQFQRGVSQRCHSIALELVDFARRRVGRVLGPGKPHFADRELSSDHPGSPFPVSITLRQVSSGESSKINMPKQFGFAALDDIFLVVEKARDYSWAFSIFNCDFESERFARHSKGLTKGK